MGDLGFVFAIGGFVSMVMLVLVVIAILQTSSYTKATAKACEAILKELQYQRHAAEITGGSPPPAGR